MKLLIFFFAGVLGAGPGDNTRVSRASQHFEDTKFILRGYSGERGSSESGSCDRRCPVTLEETREEVLRIMAKHPGASLVKIADLFMQEFPRYTPRMNGNKVQRIKSNAALQSEMGPAEIGNAWWGQTRFAKREILKQLYAMMAEEVSRNGGRKADAVTVKAIVQKRMQSDTGSIVPSSHVDSAFSHARATGE